MFNNSALLSQYSNYKIGGPARYFVEVDNVDDLAKALEIWRLRNPSLLDSAHGREIFILAGGTNVLFKDSGFDGLILRPNFRLIENDRNNLVVGAGVLIDELLDYTIKHSLSGLEWAGGLPGTLGGAVYGNAGAFGGEIKDIIEEVVSLDITTGRPHIVSRNNEECGFAYRSSVFKRNPGREIIIEATLVLKKGDRKQIESEMLDKINYRKQRQPLEYPNIGSIFKNVNLEFVPTSKRNQFKSVIKPDPFPVVPTAHLISEAGLKGVSYGGAMISPKHPNFIVNAMNAASADVINLIELAKSRVKSKFGINLEEEIEYVP